MDFSSALDEEMVGPAADAVGTLTTIKASNPNNTSLIGNDVLKILSS